MAGFLFTFLAVMLAGLGARDQAAVAGLTMRQGQRPAVLAVAVAISIATAAASAWAATAIAPQLAPRARAIMAALALGFAAVEAGFLKPRPHPHEPTNSLAALGVVLAALQITDAARFLVFAIALATAATIPAALGGALGGAVALAVAWAEPALFTDPRLRTARRIIAGLFAVLTAIVAIRALAP